MNNIDDLLGDPFDTQKTDDTLDVATKDEKNEVITKTFDSLSDDEKEKAKGLAKQIKYDDAELVLSFGTNAQKKIGQFSHNVLNHVQNQDLDDAGGIGETINELMFHLKQSDPKDLTPEKQNVFQRMFRKAKKSIHEQTAKYQQIGDQVDTIALELDNHRKPLLEDNKMLSEMYEENLDYYRALNIYIAAGELQLLELNNEIIPQALIEAEANSDQMLVQRVSDLNQHTNRLDKRVHDLKITRQITLQQAPQIRLIQNTNQALAERIQTSINTTIPLWKNQIVIALTLLRKQDAVEAQRKVADATNDMLLSNSQMLKQSSIETAHETERAVVDIETLQQTQTDLIETLEQTLQIQSEGSAKRREAELQLEEMEDQLRVQLLEINQNSQTN